MFSDYKYLEAVKECESWIEHTDMNLSLFGNNRNNIIQTIKEHHDWNLKWGSGKHFKLEDTDNIENYRDFLVKKTKEILKDGSLTQVERGLFLVNNFKLIKDGGDPLIPEKEGGLSLKFKFCNIRNSGLGKNFKKNCPPIYFNTTDFGKNISNMLLRVYRIVNNC